MLTSCRVCRTPVKPWRRDWRRPHTTIHQTCLEGRCRYCGATFTVRKERRGLYCSNAHQAAYKRNGGPAMPLTQAQVDLLDELLEQARDNAEDDMRESDGEDRATFKARRDECVNLLNAIPSLRG